MKGTLFSADFVKDSNQSLRLLELNTDTAIMATDFPNVDLSGFFAALQTNNITQLDIIYKPYIHKDFVDFISGKVATDAPFITSVVEHPEDANTIYPSVVEDAADKFILRLAYDESAILDSTYAKNRLEVFKLFTDNSITDTTVAHYYSSSASGITNTLNFTLNEDNIPDAAVKDIDESFNPIDFFKIGSEVEGETVQDRWNAFIDANKAEDKLIEQFHFHESSLNEGKVTSVRLVSIVYGPSLDLVHILSGKKTSIFELPTNITSEINTGTYSNKLGDHHYYEFTTNFIKDGSAGVLDSHKILMGNDTFSPISDVVIGDLITSYFISGSPQIEGDLDSFTWSLPGSSFPSGSYVTSSEVVFRDEKDLKYGGLVEIKVDSDSVFVGVGKQFLIYDSGSDVTSYKLSQYIDPAEDYFYDRNGNLIDIDEANFYVTTDSGLKLVELDVEDTDTYIISGSTSFNSIVSHNAPCFVGGTKITLADGSLVNIEDVNIGDLVLSYNFKNGYAEPQPVEGIGAKKVQKTVTYTFEDGSTLEATLDHPLYCKNHGWVSKDPAYTSGVYNLTTTEVKPGCDIMKQDKTSSVITNVEVTEKETVVYNLKTVAVNHNFFANEYLVHNRGCFIAGTTVTLEDGSLKVIEDVKEGEKILTFNTEKWNAEPGTVEKIVELDAYNTLKITFDDNTEIICTPDHPFLVLGEGWPEAKHLKVGDTCIKKDKQETKIVSIEESEGLIKVYNLLSVADNHNFYANGILVHNKL